MARECGTLKATVQSSTVPSQQTNRLLDEEERDDTGLRDNFKEKWSRTPSSELNKTFREEVTKYQGILGQAGQADSTVKEKYASCRKAVEILSKSEEEVAQMIPKGGHTAARSGSQVRFIEVFQSIGVECDCLPCNNTYVGFYWPLQPPILASLYVRTYVHM